MLLVEDEFIVPKGFHSHPVFFCFVCFAILTAKSEPRFV